MAKPRPALPAATTILPSLTAPVSCSRKSKSSCPRLHADSAQCDPRRRRGSIGFTSVNWHNWDVPAWAHHTAQQRVSAAPLGGAKSENFSDLVTPEAKGGGAQLITKYRFLNQSKGVICGLGH